MYLGECQANVCEPGPGECEPLFPPVTCGEVSSRPREGPGSCAGSCRLVLLTARREPRSLAITACRARPA